MTGTPRPPSVAADPTLTQDALRTVILYTLTDVFGLATEETMWAGYHLEEALEPLNALKPTQVPLPVRQEMLEATYSQQLSRIEARGSRTVTASIDPVHATVAASINDWVGVLMQMVSSCYTLRPMVESTLTGRLAGLLRELGVGSGEGGRPARYLPNDIRYRLNHTQH